MGTFEDHWRGERRFGYAVGGTALAGIAALVGLGAIAVDAFEQFVRLAAEHENWELDELASVLFVFGLGAIILMLLRTRQLQQEIGRRRRSEQAAVRSSTLLDLAQQGAGAARWDLDLTNMELAFCDRGRAMVGLQDASGPTVTTDWIQAVVPEDRGSVWNRLGKALANESTFSAEYRVRMSDGSIRWIETFGNVMFDVAGGSRRITGLQLDVTERKAAAEKLRELENQLIHLSRVSDMAALASALAHELNQPLAAISNYARGSLKLLRLPVERPDQLEVGLTKIEENAIRAGEIIRRLREMIKTGEVRREPVQLARIVEEANSLAVLSTPVRDVVLEQQIAPDIVVEADPVQIQQVIFNLVRNALEAMAHSDRRELVIGAERAEGAVRIRIADTGCGMSAERRELLFQPFSSGKDGGLGVGLSICRTIVEAHGGRIWAEESDAGACFCFSLPLADATETGA